MSRSQKPHSTVTDGLDDLARQLTPPMLNVYFHGQLLSAEGLKQGQLQGRYTSALLASMLVPAAPQEGGAVLKGLDVPDLKDASAEPVLTVQPGVAIDGFGRLVIVPDPSSQAGNGERSGPATLKLAGHLPAIAADTVAQIFDLVLYHDLVPVQESPVLAGDACGQEPEYATSLEREGYRLDLVAPANPPPQKSFVDLFPIEPDTKIADYRPAALTRAGRQTVTLGTQTGGGAPIAEAQGVTLARVTATPDASKKVWTVTAETSTRREVLPMGELTQLILGLAAQVDTSLRRRYLNTVSGNAQTGEPGKPLGNPLVVKVVSADGSIVPGAEVIFEVTGGNGSLAAASAATNDNGLAQVLWTLGPDEGLNAVEASIAPDQTMIVSGPVTFVALGKKPSPPALPPPALALEVSAQETVLEIKKLGLKTEESKVVIEEASEKIEPLLGTPEPAPDQADSSPEAREPRPSEVTEPTGAPALTGCDPIGQLDWKRVTAWLNQPVLSLTFDRPMDPGDFTGWPDWLHVVRVRQHIPLLSAEGIPRTEAERVKTSFVPAESPALKRGSRTACFNLELQLEADDDGPDGTGVFVVLIDLKHGHPLAAGRGSALEVPFSNIALREEEFAQLWEIDDPEGGFQPVPIDWPRFVPGKSRSNVAAAGSAGHCQVVFYFGRPDGFDKAD